mmetsp:Transcript_22809/g.27574  ORF Transcript_22809/g.27574 Transcript_22809/m.27574 type:complete len:267 (+) Transcript_22809:100-900(+)
MKAPGLTLIGDTIFQVFEDAESSSVTRRDLRANANQYGFVELEVIVPRFENNKPAEDFVQLEKVAPQTTKTHLKQYRKVVVVSTHPAFVKQLNDSIALWYAFTGTDWEGNPLPSRDEFFESLEPLLRNILEQPFSHDLATRFTCAISHNRKNEEHFTPLNQWLPNTFVPSNVMEPLQPTELGFNRLCRAPHGPRNEVHYAACKITETFRVVDQHYCEKVFDFFDLLVNGDDYSIARAAQAEYITQVGYVGPEKAYQAALQVAAALW